MRIAIYGAGAVGTTLGAYLAKGGVEADLFDSNADYVEALNEKGAKISGTDRFNAKIKAMYPDNMEGVYDIIFLATKQLENNKIVQGLLPHLAKDGVIVSLQNGIPELRIAEIVGDNRVIGAATYWGATVMKPGSIALTTIPASMSFSIGMLAGASNPKLDDVKKLLTNMCHTNVEENLLGARWSHLILTSTFSGLATVIGARYNDVTENGDSRRIAQRVLKEGLDVAKLLEIPLAKVEGKDLRKKFYFNGALKEASIYLKMHRMLEGHSRIMPSMLHDIEKGVPSEVDYLNGLICKYGRRTGVDTPFNDRIVEIIKDIEKGEKSPMYENVGFFYRLMYPYRGDSNKK